MFTVRPLRVIVRALTLQHNTEARCWWWNVSTRALSVCSLPCTATCMLPQRPPVDSVEPLPILWRTLRVPYANRSVGQLYLYWTSVTALGSPVELRTSALRPFGCFVSLKAWTLLPGYGDIDEDDLQKGDSIESVARRQRQGSGTISRRYRWRRLQLRSGRADRRTGSRGEPARCLLWPGTLQASQRGAGVDHHGSTQGRLGATLQTRRSCKRG